MPLPNFFIIGAPKCGTTSLYEYVRQHPDVYMSPLKEPVYWAFDPDGPRDPDRLRKFRVTTREEYERLFEGATGQRILGEASPVYLASERAARAIRENIPHAKMVVLFRDPAEATFSAFLGRIRDGRESRRDLGRFL